MSQVKIYGLKEKLDLVKKDLSDVIHECVVEALEFPKDKRAHRFIGLAKDDFYYPDGRSEAYTIIELIMIEGRTVETKKKLVKLLFERIKEKVGISEIDIEICIMEAPAHNWGFRGFHGDEVKLNYKVSI